MSRGLSQFKEEAQARVASAEKDLASVVLMHMEHVGMVLQRWTNPSNVGVRCMPDDARILIKELTQAIEQVQRLERAYGALYMVQKWEEVTSRE